MLMEVEACPDSKLFHHDERGSILEGIVLVCVLNEVVPRIPKENFIDMGQFDRGAFQYRSAQASNQLPRLGFSSL